MNGLDVVFVGTRFSLAIECAQARSAALGVPIRIVNPQGRVLAECTAGTWTDVALIEAQSLAEEPS